MKHSSRERRSTAFGKEGRDLIVKGSDLTTGSSSVSLNSSIIPSGKRDKNPVSHTAPTIFFSLPSIPANHLFAGLKMSILF